MTPDNLGHLEALLGEATPGPWLVWRTKPIKFGPTGITTRQEEVTTGDNLAPVNANLIVALVNAAPGLIAKARERDVLAGQVAAVRVAAEFYRFKGKGLPDDMPDEWDSFADEIACKILRALDGGSE